MKENEEELETRTGCSSGCESCGGCHDNGEEDYEPTITLIDEDGKESKFEILDVIVLENEKQYLVVTEAGKDESEAEAVILEIKEENGEEIYDTVTDEAIADEVFNAYVAQFDEDDDDSEDDDDEDDEEEDKE
jgi:uncharacterized protein YrzB (UPF0473 family)